MSTNALVKTSDEKLGITGGFETRQDLARQACEQAGITWPGTILPPGTALYTDGVATLRNDRRNWRRLPLAAEVIGLVASALEAEQRVDLPVLVPGVRLRKTDGRIVRLEHFEQNTPVEFGLGYGPHSFRQLVQQITPLDSSPKGFASALLYLSDQERAEIVNKRLAIMEAKDADQVMLRTKLPANTSARIVRATLSGKYGSVTDHDIAQAIGLIMTGDTTGKLDYKPGDSRSRFEVIWPSEIPVETFVVGDVHYACLSISNSETGEGSIRITPAVVRARCANLTLSVGEGINEDIRHIGDPAKLMFRLKKAIQRAIDDLEPLINTITVSGKVGLGKFSAAEAIAAIAKKYELPKTSVAGILEQHKSSLYPDTVWGVTSAISEAAHSVGAWTDEADWERVASTVIAKTAEVVRVGTAAAYAFEKALSIN